MVGKTQVWFTRNDNRQPDGGVQARIFWHVGYFLGVRPIHVRLKPATEVREQLVALRSLVLRWQRVPVWAARLSAVQTETSTSSPSEHQQQSWVESFLCCLAQHPGRKNAGGVHQWSSPVAANWQDCGKFLPRQRGSCRMSSLFHTHLPLHWIGAASLLRRRVCWHGCINLLQIRNKSANQCLAIPAIQGCVLLTVWLVNLVLNELRRQILELQGEAGIKKGSPRGVSVWAKIVCVSCDELVTSPWCVSCLVTAGEKLQKPT